MLKTNTDTFIETDIDMATQNKSKSKYLDRVLVGSCYDHPSTYDVYSDGSNAADSGSKKGKNNTKDPSNPVEIDAQALQYIPEVTTYLTESKPLIAGANPPAGKIRAVDLGAPWMESVMVSILHINISLCIYVYVFMFVLYS